MPETMTENLLALADFISSFRPYLAATFSNSWDKLVQDSLDVTLCQY